MSTSLSKPSGWSWRSDGRARTDQHQSFNTRGTALHSRAASEISAGDFLAAFHARVPNLVEELGAPERRELISLSQESDVALLQHSLALFARRLESRGEWKIAAQIFSAIQHPATSGEHYERALGQFGRTATDYRIIVPMLAGATAYHTARAFRLSRMLQTPASWSNRGLAANFRAALWGLSFEASAFSLGKRALGSGNSESLTQTTLMLGVLRVTAFSCERFLAGLPKHRFLHATLPHFSQYLGLLSTQKLMGESVSTLETLGTMLSLNAGANLGRRLLGGRFNQWRNELHSRVSSRPLTNWMNWPLQPNAIQGLALAQAKPNLAPSLTVVTKPPQSLALMEGNGASLPEQRKLADKNEILRRYSVLLEKFLDDPESDLSRHWQALLRLAECACTTEGDLIHARLAWALEEWPGMRNVTRSERTHLSLMLADSFYRAGKTGQGRNLLAEALKHESTLLNATALKILARHRDEVELAKLKEQTQTEIGLRWVGTEDDIAAVMSNAANDFGGTGSMEAWVVSGGFSNYAMKVYEIESLLQNNLDFPFLYRDGLKRLKQFPAASHLLGYYRYAAFRMPPDFSDLERRELAESYWRILQDQKEGYFQAALEQHKPLVPPEDSFENSRFFWDHAQMVANIYLSSSEGSTRRLGMDIILRELSTSTVEQDAVRYGRGVGSLSRDGNLFDADEKFLPALWRIDAILKRLKHFDADEREFILRDSFLALKKLEAWGENSLNRGSLIVDLASYAFRYGHFKIAEQVIVEWDQYLEAEIAQHLGKSKPGKRSPKAVWPALRSESRMMFRLLRALANTDRGMRDWLEEMEHGGAMLRRQFSLEDHLLALDYLSRKQIVAGLQDPEAALEGFAAQTVSRFSDYPPESQLEFWEVMLETLLQMPLSPAALDRTMLHLLKTATPVLEGHIDPELDNTLVWRAYRHFAFVLGNPEYPASEAFLLKQIATKLKRDHALTESDILEQLDWVFVALGKKSH